MRPTLFISDVHLCESRPHINALFLRFLSETATAAKSLYILGDLFEYWIGDDQLDHDPLARKVADALRRVAESGVNIFFIHGNRDFLIGERFAHEAGLNLLNEPTLIDLNGQRCLLLHGDTLCTDDVAYQAFRRQSRNPAWQAVVLAKPYDERQQLAQSIRMQSDSAKSGKSEEIMDVAEPTVTEMFRLHDYPLMIHGHTHRPARHLSEINGHRCERWVLADWYQHGEVLQANKIGMKRYKLEGTF